MIKSQLDEQFKRKSMSDRRMLHRIFFVLTAFVFMSLLAMLSRPGLQNIRGVDVLHLVGIGLCFGGAIVSLVAYFNGRRLS